MRRELAVALSVIALTLISFSLPRAQEEDAAQPLKECDADRQVVVAALLDPRVHSCVSAARQKGFEIRPKVTRLTSCFAGGFLHRVDFLKAPKCRPGRPCILIAPRLIATVELDCDDNVTNVTCRTGGVVRLGEEFTLKVGQGTVVEDLRLSFKAVKEDSRCPANAICVWEGNAKIIVEVAKGAATALLELNTSRRFPTEAVFEGYNIRLVSLAPYPGTVEKITPAAYKATLVVTKSAEDAPDVPSADR